MNNANEKARILKNPTAQQVQGVADPTTAPDNYYSYLISGKGDCLTSTGREGQERIGGSSGIFLFCTEKGIEAR